MQTREVRMPFSHSPWLLLAERRVEVKGIIPLWVWAKPKVFISTKNKNIHFRNKVDKVDKKNEPLTGFYLFYGLLGTTLGLWWCLPPKWIKWIEIFTFFIDSIKKSGYNTDIGYRK